MKRQYLLSLLSVCLMVFVMSIIPILRIPYHFYINYDEGWNAYHALSAWHGNLYGNVFTPVNYPPLSFYLLGMFPKPLIAGRIIALVSLLINCFFVSLLVYKSNKNLFASFTSGVLALAIFLGLAQYYVGMDDPQLMAQTIMLLGFVLYFLRKNLFIVALLITISLFIKQNLLAIPLVIILDLYWINKKGLIKLIAYLITFSIIGLLGSRIISHGQFISSILIKREFNITNVITLIKITILPIFSLFIISAFYKKKDIFLYYAILSLVIGLFFSIGAGVDVNINFDLFFSVSILVGLLLSLKRNIIFIIVFQVVILFGIRIYQHNLYYPVQQRENEALKIISLIKNTKGDVLCENIEMCYFAGKPFIYDPYLVNEEIKSNVIKESYVIELLKNKKFKIVQIYQPLQKEQGKFSYNFMITLRENYLLLDDLYIPKK